MWDVVVVGGGPAGLTAGRVAAERGASVVVLERGAHPRYKVCGGGLIGASLAAVGGVDVPVRERVGAAVFTRDGRWRVSRRAREPFVAMVLRAEFDAALAVAARAAGVEIREDAVVRGVSADGRVELADGSALTAGVVIGADGSAGVSGRCVGVRYGQVDLGLEAEVRAPAATMRRWRGRLWLDWGAIPGSYAWVFPKGDSLTVGVIAERGRGAATRAYLDGFLRRLGAVEVVRSGGHLTRCRTADSPLRQGRVLVVGDAAGLLEPWTREGISYALRSGAAAGAAAVGGDLGAYERNIERTLLAEMAAGRRLHEAFRAHPNAFHALLATPPGWRAFTGFCRGDSSFADALGRIPRWVRRLAR